MIPKFMSDIDVQKKVQLNYLPVKSAERTVFGTRMHIRKWFSLC